MANSPTKYSEQEVLSRSFDETTESVRTTGGGSATAGQTAPTGSTQVSGVARDVGDKQSRTNGQSSNMITDLQENQWMREAYAPLYEDNVAGVAKVEHRYTYANINTAATTIVKSGAGHIHQILVLGGTLGNITVYDNTAASGTTIVPTINPAAAGLLIQNVSFSTGLTIVTAAATIIVISYR